MTTVLIVVALMIFGLALLAIEVLVLPGFGVIGLFGIIAAVSSGYMAITELDAGHAALTISAGVVAAGVLFWLFPRTGLGKAMVLETQTLGSAADPALKELSGCSGVAITPLRPAGAVEIAGKPIDVVSDGQYVETGTAVRVIRVEGSRVVVEPVA